MREERRQQQGSTHSVEGKKKQTHRPLSHTSSVTERNKQVCCTALSLPPPLLFSLGGARLLRDSQAAARRLLLTARNKTCRLHSPAFPPPCCREQAGVKMMQEVSIMVAYDAHVVDRPGEEDALACLVAHSRPRRAPRPVVGLF